MWQIVQILFAHKRRGGAYMRSQAPRHIKAAGIKTQKSSRVLRPPPIGSRLIHQNEDEKLKRGRANAQPPSGQRDDGSAWFKRHRHTRQLSPQRRSLGDGRHLGLCFPVSVSRRMSAGHPSTCPTSVGHVWPADSSETVHRTVARFALPSEHEHQLATWGVRFIPNGGKSTGTSGRSGGGESAKSTCTAQCAETAVTPRSGWAG